MRDTAIDRAKIIELLNKALMLSGLVWKQIARGVAFCALTPAKEEGPASPTRTNAHAFYPELESLRGVAALCVVILHTILLFAVGNHLGPQGLAQYGTTTFLVAQIGIIIFNGQSAVLLFFVLSGFVMGLGFDATKKLDLGTYARFLIRRFFRLLPPLWAVTIFAVILGVSVHGMTFSLYDILHYFLLTDLSINPVEWTLVLEIAMCIGYPLMFFAVSRLTTGAQIIALAICYWYFGSTPSFYIYYGQTAGGLPVLAFFLGLIVPTIGRELIGILPRGGTALLPIAFAAFVAPTVATWYADFHPKGVVTPTTIGQLQVPVQFACFYIIAWLIYSPHRLAAEILRRPKFLAPGRWSYSIYIYHPPILGVIIVYLGFQQMPLLRLAIGLAGVMPLTLIIAAVSYRYVELPSIRLGRRLVDMWLARYTATPSGAAPLAQDPPIPAAVIGTGAEAAFQEGGQRFDRRHDE